MVWSTAGFTLVMIEGVGWGATVAALERISRQLRGLDRDAGAIELWVVHGVTMRDGFGVSCRLAVPTRWVR